MKMSNPQNIVVIGGGYAGTLAAIRIAGKTKHSNTQVTLVNADAYFVERIRLHQHAAGQARPRHAYTDLLEGAHVHFVQGRVERIDPVQNRLQIRANEPPLSIDYDILVYALGSGVAAPPADFAQHCFTLTDWISSHRLRDAVERAAQNGGRLLVIGAGLTGIEAATELAERYAALHVTLVTQGRVGQGLSAEGSDVLRHAFVRLGICLVEESTVVHIADKIAMLDDNRQIPCDVVLWAGGFEASSVAALSGFKVDAQKRILVDERLRTLEYPNIFVAGDAASTKLRMACATAMPMGAFVADQVIAAVNDKVVSTRFRFAYALQCISLGRRNALVQKVHPDDSPISSIISGRAAVIIKELICRYTILALKLERRFPGLYRWPEGGKTMKSLT